MKNVIMLRNAGAMILAATMAMTVVAFAQHGMGHGFDGDNGDRMAKSLELTDAQQGQIKSIREGFNTANASTMQQIKALHEQMKQQMQNKDSEGAKATREQVKAKMESMKPAREQMMTQIRGVLNATQQAKFDELIAGRNEHRGDCKGHRGEGRQNGNQQNGNQQGDRGTLK